MPVSKRTSGSGGDGSSVAGNTASGGRKRKSKPSSKKRNRKQKVKETYSKAREDAQLAGVIPTTPEGAVRPERVDPSSQSDGASKILPGLVSRALRSGWAVDPLKAAQHVEELSAIIDNPEETAKSKIAAFNALRQADQMQWERDNPKNANDDQNKPMSLSVNIVTVSSNESQIDAIEYDDDDDTDSDYDNNDIELEVVEVDRSDRN